MAPRADRPPIGLSWIVTWPLSAVFAALVFLSAEELHHPARQVAAPPPPSVGGADWSARFPARIAVVDAALHKGRLRLPKPVEEERGSGPLRWTHRRYDIDLPRGEQGQAEAAVEALRGVDPGLAVTADNSAEGTDVRVGLDGLLISTLRFRFGEQVTPKPPEPRLVVVIGPLGDDLRVAREVVALDAPVVLGVRPFRPFSREVSELGRLFNREVVAQLDGSEAEPDGERVAAVAGQVDVDAVLASVPRAVGIAWQAKPGTRPAPDPQLVDAVERRQLLFVGARAPQAEKHSGLPEPTLIAADQQAEAVAAQLGALVAKARSDGPVIAIGAPTEATLATLAQVLPEWRAAEVEIIPLSALGTPVNLSAR
jgi:polysaccharide deacetylase 2 family uncharacterized protein YibQ